MTGPLSISHPDMLALLVDVEAEQITWSKSRRNGRTGTTYRHDDGRDLTSQIARFRTTGMIHLCKGPGQQNGGTVELTAAGVYHITAEAIVCLGPLLAGIPWGPARVPA